MFKISNHIIALTLCLGSISALEAFAPTIPPGQAPPPSPYANPANNQGLQPRDSLTIYQDGNIVRDVSDKEISAQIKAILSSGDFKEGYQNLTFTVSDGIVTLRGHVTRPENKLMVEDRIRKVKGVVLINNEISIYGSDNKISPQ